MSDLDDFYVHTVTVRTLTGTGGMGNVYATPFPLACFVDDVVRLVRGPDAAEVVSSSTVYAPAGTTTLTPGSLVTLPSGREATVITSANRTSGALELPDHVEAACT